MRKLILVKHASPQVVPDVPPERWALSEEGRHRCIPLSEGLRPHQPAVVVSSVEPKAAETGQIVAARLGLPFATAAGLHEHDRTNVPHLRSREFISMMEVFFRKPGQLVLGRETADEALRRFEAAVSQVMADHPDGNVAVVSHGTVVALLVAKCGQRKPFDLWRRMGLPSFAVLAVPGYHLDDVVESIPQG